MGGPPGAIPWSAIDKYADRFGYTTDPETYDRFVRLIEDLDREFLTHISK